MIARAIRTSALALALGLLVTACQTPSPPPANRLPTGSIGAVRTPAGVEVRGHAADPDDPGEPVQVRVSVNGTVRASGLADAEVEGRTDGVQLDVTDLAGIDAPILAVCLDARDHGGAGFVPVGCELVAGTRIVSNGAVGSIVDRTTGLYWVHGVVVDPNRDGPVPMRLRSLAGGVEVDLVTFLADDDTTGSANPLVQLVTSTMHAYGHAHGFDRSGLLDTSGADAVELDARRVDGVWEQVASY